MKQDVKSDQGGEDQIRARRFDASHSSGGAGGSSSVADRSGVTDPRVARGDAGGRDPLAGGGETDERFYTIAELAREFAVTPRALRFYEAEGLLRPERQGQTRLYRPRDRARLAWILRGKRVGFSLAEIKELIDLYDLPDHRETQRRLTLEKCRERIEALERQRADIEQVLIELRAFTQLVEEVLADPSREPEARARFHAVTRGVVGRPVPRERLEAVLKEADRKAD
ncbi:MAG: MerR family DNA-binding transcriptional regulator [Alphaproteobacteria bacterium]|nr:MAG: MerR family DNA-binding transcriptional regulator [Alphaproteobacteria bacterium]